jgi:general secretion pathway protein K
MKRACTYRAAPGQAQRGAAILMAMLTVVLVATLASAMLWQQWRVVEVESAQRTRVQSQWILTGALDWAKMILHEDAGNSDNLTEPWAVPLAPARLSTFLAAQQGQATVGDDDDPSQEAFLSGNIEDLQSRLNLTNLIEGGKVHAVTLAAWTRLFKQLDLPEAELDTLTQNLLLALAAGAVTAKGAAPVNPNAPPSPLMPQSVAELTWLGLSDTTLSALSPYIMLLPVSAAVAVRTKVNLNTAPLEVLVASVPNLTPAQARQLIQSRATQPLGTMTDASLVVTDPKVKFDSAEQGVASSFFSATGRLRVGANTVEEQSVLQRNGLLVKTLSRKRGVLVQSPAGAPLQ